MCNMTRHFIFTATFEDSHYNFPFPREEGEAHRGKVTCQDSWSYSQVLFHDNIAPA